MVLSSKALAQITTQNTLGQPREQENDREQVRDESSEAVITTYLTNDINRKCRMIHNEPTPIGAHNHSKLYRIDPRSLTSRIMLGWTQILRDNP
ncbi:hypothetical protein AVEN_91077-1 [Araneus ventricosus]|uniref:Uncharacterized protein n=1 Tax=Araneus ventricosus TaxID=182803 RepID=A0A4Y2K680_ARAVE|nr:hypothetical protein AVEN_91077-1 [Araneus ventricosus]